MRQVLLVFILFASVFTVEAQYAPQAGLFGSDAVSKTSSLFVGWANKCTVHRGYMNIADTSLGYASLGDSTLAQGPADGTVVSLGDSGIAVLTFSSPIYNGPGADFAVFENGFADPADSELAYLELGFVEVSSDGVNYFRFPANSLTPDTSQVSNTTYMDARYLHNLAGKYVEGYGTPFDLEELSGIPGLDINNITHVRVIDVIGSIGEHASFDSADRKVNDPYPTPFPSCGFDLDAVGVIHLKTTAVNAVAYNIGITVYPNPTTDKVLLSVNDLYKNGLTAVLTDMTGKILSQLQLTQSNNELQVSQYQSGVYFIILQDTKGNRWVERITKL